MRCTIPIITIITLTCNQLENATKPFLKSLYTYTPEELFQLIIVDNNSNDGTREFLEQFKNTKNNIEVIYNEENLGYSKGNNIGLKRVRTQYIGLLNNDILLSPSWLENTISIFEKGKKVGLVSPKMLMKGKKHDNYLQATKENYLVKGESYKLKSIEDFSMYFAPQFSCVLMSKQVFDAVGFLDENFTPAFYEDVDYMARVWMAGYKCYVANKAFFFHNHNQTSSRMEEREKIMERNREYLKEKNYMASELERLYTENNQLKYHIGKYSLSNRILAKLGEIYKWMLK